MHTFSTGAVLWIRNMAPFFSLHSQMTKKLQFSPMRYSPVNKNHICLVMVDYMAHVIEWNKKRRWIHSSKFDSNTSNNNDKGNIDVSTNAFDSLGVFSFTPFCVCVLLSSFVMVAFSFYVRSNLNEHEQRTNCFFTYHRELFYKCWMRYLTAKLLFPWHIIGTELKRLRQYS